MIVPLQQRPDDDSCVDDLRLVGEADGRTANRLLDALMREMGFEAADVRGGSMTAELRSQIVLSVCTTCHHLPVAQKVPTMRVLLEAALIEGHVRRCIAAFVSSSPGVRLETSFGDEIDAEYIDALFVGPIGSTLLELVSRTRRKLEPQTVVFEILSILSNRNQSEPCSE